MKNYLPYGVALAILGLAATPLISQTQTTTSSSSSSGYIQTSKIIGTKVKTQSGEEVGVVKDVVIDRGNGCMAYTVLSAGGTGSRVTGQSKMVAVPWSVYTVSPDASYLTTTIERDRIYNGPVFEYSRIGDPSFTSTVYSTFGVSAGVGVSSATSTTTGVNAQTQQAQTNANTARTTTDTMNNPPPPAAGPTNNPSPGSSAPNASAAPTASAAANTSPEPSASAPSKSTRGAKGGNTPASSPRRHGDETMKGTGMTNENESTGGTSTSGTKGAKGSKKGSNAEKSTDTESSAETTESPSGKKSSHKKSSKTETETAPSPGEQE